MSVINKLKKEFNKSFERKGGQECPKCGKNTFSIKLDDSLAKCFHPSCLFVYLPYNTCQPKKCFENDLLEKIFKVFNEKFKTNQEGRAYNYCKEERVIDELVLDKALVGEATELPKEYLEQVSNLYEITSKRLEEIKEKNNPLLSSNKNTEEEIEALQARKSVLNKFQEFLKKHKKYEGWFVTAFTDENLKILSLKFRKPYTKYRASLKPYNKLGVFGLSLFKFLDNNKKRKLILTEGEFNTLQLQSFLTREKRELACTEIVSFGSASSPDLATILNLKSILYLCRDNDDAGKACESKFSEETNLYTFTVPIPGGDLDDYLKPEPNRNINSTDIKKLIKEAKFIEMKHEVSIQRSNTARNSNGKNTHYRNQKTAEFVIKDICEKCELFKSGGQYFLLRKMNSQAYRLVHKDENLNSLFISLYKINPSEDIYKYIIAELIKVVIDNGAEVKISFFTSYIKKNNRLLMFNFKDTVYEIDSKGNINLSNNGDNGVLFLQNKDVQPFKLNLDEKPTTTVLNSELLTNVLSKSNFKPSSQINKQEYGLLLLYYFYTFLFMSKFDTRPIACFIGEKGSGKTTGCKHIGKILYGSKFKPTALPPKEDDFDVMISNGAFHVLDNVDNTPNWLLDRLAVISTGANIKKRELYTTNKLVELTVDCMLFITSRTPRFTRDDIADRTLPFYFDRLSENGYIPESELNGNIDSKREGILNEIAKVHIPFVLKCFENQSNETYRSSLRMAEFSNFIDTLSKGLGLAEKGEKIIHYIEKAQKEFAVSDSPIFEILDLYVSIKHDDEQFHTTYQIYDLVKAEKKRNGLDIHFNSPQSFTSHLVNNISNLADFYTFEVKTERSRRKTYNIKSKSNSGISSINSSRSNAHWVKGKHNNRSSSEPNDL